MKGYIDVPKIEKPLSETDNYTYVGIYDKYIKQAQKENKYLRITVPRGTGIVTAKQWLKGATRLEKIYKIPNQPMILYANKLKLTQGSRYTIGEDGVARL